MNTNAPISSLLTISQALHEPKLASATLRCRMDIMAANPYHGTQDEFDGVASSMVGDYTRSLKKTNYLVTETNAQTIGWDSKEQFPPYDGQLRLDVYTHLSSGANMVEYWHWHSIHNGQETYWKGVLWRTIWSQTAPTRSQPHRTRAATHRPAPRRPAQEQQGRHSLQCRLLLRH